MKRYSTLVILAALSFLACGFDWGFGVEDKCGKAKEIASGLTEIKGEAGRSDAESQITKLCPDGAAEHFIRALNLERGGNLEGALTEYQAALKDDPEFGLASGNLGLLYLQKGLQDDAVEIDLVLVPIVRVLLQDHSVAGRPGLQDIGTSANRIAIVIVALFLPGSRGVHRRVLAGVRHQRGPVYRGIVEVIDHRQFVRRLRDPVARELGERRRAESFKTVRQTAGTNAIGAVLWGRSLRNDEV